MSIKYTKSHEWIEIKDGVGTIGITDYAQSQLGDVVFVELPEVGNEVKQSDEIAVVESVKAASEIYSPVSGEVLEVNTLLEDEPATVNSSPMESGWFLKIKIINEDELQELLSEEEYKKIC